MDHGAGSSEVSGVRFDSEGVHWPATILRAGVTLDWSGIRRLALTEQGAVWIDASGRRHGRPAASRELREALLQGWTKQLVREARQHGSLERNHRQGWLARHCFDVSAFIALAAGLGAGWLALRTASLPPLSPATDLGQGALVLPWFLASLLMLASAAAVARAAWRHRELLDARALRIGPEGIGLRDAAGQWRLVLASSRTAVRGPRSWPGTVDWLHVYGPLAGLGDLPLLLMTGWARRSGRERPIVAHWDARSSQRRLALRLALLWPPIAVAATATWARLAGVDLPWQLLPGLAYMLLVLAFVLGWESRRVREDWTTLGSRADALLRSLGW